MAYQSIWYMTNLPEKVVEVICEDLNNFGNQMNDSLLSGDSLNKDKKSIKNSGFR